MQARGAGDSLHLLVSWLGLLQVRGPVAEMGRPRNLALLNGAATTVRQFTIAIS